MNIRSLKAEDLAQNEAVDHFSPSGITEDNVGPYIGPTSFLCFLRLIAACRHDFYTCWQTYAITVIIQHMCIVHQLCLCVCVCACVCVSAQKLKCRSGSEIDVTWCECVLWWILQVINWWHLTFTFDLESYFCIFFSGKKIDYSLKTIVTFRCTLQLLCTTHCICYESANWNNARTLRNCGFNSGPNLLMIRTPASSDCLPVVM